MLLVEDPLVLVITFTFIQKIRLNVMIALLSAVIPVSYTHLDVYKRQLYTIADIKT